MFLAANRSWVYDSFTSRHANHDLATSGSTAASDQQHPATADDADDHENFRTASTAFKPPKANELDSAASMRIGRAAFGT